jgi:hypothetical protein
MNTTTVIKTIGMDMVYPYCVYVNGERIAQFETEVEANRLYEKLRQQGESQKKPLVN